MKHIQPKVEFVCTDWIDKHFLWINISSFELFMNIHYSIRSVALVEKIFCSLLKTNNQNNKPELILINYDLVK